MFYPNLKCTIEKVSSTDVYGRARTRPPVTEGCAVVRLKQEAARTTVRADASGSRGYAEEFVNTNRILLGPKTTAQIDDKLTVLGHEIRVRTMWPRHGINGKLDHYEVEGSVWA